MTFRGSRLQWRKFSDGMEIAGKLESKVDPEDVTESLQSPDKNLINEELLLVDEKRKWFLGTESISDEDAVKTVETTGKYSEYYINLDEKVVAGFENIDSSFEKSSLGAMLSNSIRSYRESFHEIKSQSM